MAQSTVSNGMPRVKPGGTAGSFDVNAELLDALIRASPIWNRLANLRKSRQDMTMLRDKIGDLDFTEGVVQGSKSKVQQALARLDAEERILLDSPDISNVIRQLMLVSERTCTKMFEDKASSKGFATKQELQRMKEDQGLEVKKLKEDLGKVTGDVKELKHKRTVAMEDGDAPSKKRKAEAEPDSSAPVPNSANLISHTQFKKFKEEIEEESKKRESQANENFLRPYAVLADRVDYSTGVIAGLSRTLDAILKAFIDDASKITINIPNDPQRMIALKEVMRGVAEIGIKEIQDYVGRAYDDMMNRLNDERDIGTRLKQMEEKFMALTEKYEEQEGEFKKLKKRMKEMEKKQ